MIWEILFFTLSVVNSLSLDNVFSSPSGKLTYSPELVVPESRDPTAILLLSNSIQVLSQRIRKSQANAAFLEGSMDALRTFCNEQAAATGSFPGPVPVIYCNAKTKASFKDIHDAGAKGVLIPVDWKGTTHGSLNVAFVEACNAAADVGLAVIPELCVENGVDIDMDQAVACFESVLSKGPAAIVLSYAIPPDAADEDSSPAAANANTLPSVSKQTTKRIPVLYSVWTQAGENRLADAAERVKGAGYTGAFLRRQCLPGFGLQLDMEILSSFWEACVSDLKSTRSKSFSFRAKNNMEVSAATKWGNYQQNVMDSGALGDPKDSFSAVDSSAGEYKGFA